MLDRPASRRSVVLGAFALFGAAGALASMDDDGSSDTREESADISVPQNPWASNPIIVTANDHANVFNKSLAAETDDALQFWNLKMDELRWEGRFVYRESPNNPDIIVHGRRPRNFKGCGEHGKLWGCTSSYQKVGQADGTTRIEVKSTNSDFYVEAVIAHELGHNLGLGHSDTEEFPIMDPQMGRNYMRLHFRD